MEKLSFKSCFIFNPNLKSNKKKPTDDEKQDAKLLIYYPSCEEILVKRSNMGIIEGTILFNHSFNNVKEKNVIETNENSSDISFYNTSLKNQILSPEEEDDIYHNGNLYNNNNENKNKKNESMQKYNDDIEKFMGDFPYEINLKKEFGDKESIILFKGKNNLENFIPSMIESKLDSRILSVQKSLDEIKEEITFIKNN